MERPVSGRVRAVRAHRSPLTGVPHTSPVRGGPDPEPLHVACPAGALDERLCRERTDSSSAPGERAEVSRSSTVAPDVVTRAATPDFISCSSETRTALRSSPTLQLSDSRAAPRMGRSHRRRKGRRRMTSHAASGSAAHPREAPRQPLRLKLSPSPGQSPLDGAWWPQSHDIDLELADLVDHFPVHLGSVYRALYSKPDWTSRPRTVATARRRIRTGSFPRDDTHLMVLSMSSRRSIRLLAVPPAHPAAERCMNLATDPRNRMTGAQVLLMSMESDNRHYEVTDQWNDTGGNWWQGSRAPSFRIDPMDRARQSVARRGACT